MLGICDAELVDKMNHIRWVDRILPICYYEHKVMTFTSQTMNGISRRIILRIYLDNCCYNRPYDDLSQFTVGLEAQAKSSHIQQKIKTVCMSWLRQKCLLTNWMIIPFR